MDTLDSYKLSTYNRAIMLTNAIEYVGNGRNHAPHEHSYQGYIGLYWPTIAINKYVPNYVQVIKFMAWFVELSIPNLKEVE